MIFLSTIKPIFFLLPLIGLAIGILGTMIGGGGGFFILPILILLLKVPFQTAVITSLVVTLPVCITGTFSHYHKRNINFSIGILLGMFGIIGTFIGAEITSWINSYQLKIAFGIYSVLIALNMGLGIWQKQRAGARGKDSDASSRLSRIAKGTFFGLFGGIITGTFGTSGTAPVLAGLFSIRVPFKTAIGTSLLVVLVNTLFAVAAHSSINKINFTLVVFLTAGSTIGALLGPGLLMQVKIDRNENKLRYCYALVVLAMGILMIIS